MSGVISGTWNDIVIVCTYRHGEPVEMKPKEGPESVFFACPKYHEENREPGERACNNRLNLIDHDKIIAHIDGMRYDAEMRGEVICLNGHSWKGPRGIECRVLSHVKDRITVSVVNKLAISK